MGNINPAPHTPAEIRANIMPRLVWLGCQIEYKQMQGMRRPPELAELARARAVLDALPENPPTITLYWVETARDVPTWYTRPVGNGVYTPVEFYAPSHVWSNPNGGQGVYPAPNCPASLYADLYTHENGMPALLWYDDDDNCCEYIFTPVHK